MIQMVCLQLVPVFIFPEVRQKNICYQPMRRYCQELCLASYGLAQLVVGVSICIWWRQQFYLVIFRRNQSAVVTTVVVLLFRILHENFIFCQQLNPCICKFFICQLVIFYLIFNSCFNLPTGISDTSTAFLIPQIPTILPTLLIHLRYNI